MATEPREPDNWCVLRTYDSVSAAEVDAGYLRSDGVAAEAQPISDMPGMVRGARLIVDAALEHRARWLLKLDSVSDAELEYLATGSLLHAETDAPEDPAPHRSDFSWWMLIGVVLLAVILGVVGNVAI